MAVNSDTTTIFAGPDGVARGEDALSLLENTQTRGQFLNELMEVDTAAHSYKC